MDTRPLNLRALIFRSETAPHLWVAHCLELDVISQGSSPLEARQAIEDAVLDTLNDDLSAGLDPLGRNPAPADVLRRWDDLILRARTVDLADADVVDREQVTCFLVYLPFECQVAKKVDRRVGQGSRWPDMACAASHVAA